MLGRLAIKVFKTGEVLEVSKNRVERMWRNR